MDVECGQEDGLLLVGWMRDVTRSELVMERSEATVSVSLSAISHSMIFRPSVSYKTSVSLFQMNLL